MGQIGWGIATMLVAPSFPHAAITTRIEVGAMAPDTAITLVDRTGIALSSLRGQIVVLNFWAT